MIGKTAEFIAFFVLWALFVDKLAMGEILTGVGAAAIGAFAFEAAKRAEPLRFRPPLRALAQVWRVPHLILQGTAVLALELVRRLAGKRGRSRFELTPFRAIGADGRTAAKRALVVTFVTLPPNFLIIGIDRKSKLMLFHQVRNDPVPEIVRKLETAWILGS